jgi:hypothetical protein
MDMLRNFVVSIVLGISCYHSYGQTSFPVRISDGKHYLVHQQNNPFPILRRTGGYHILQRMIKI